ncbi:hypothetical protein JTA33_00605 [Pseudomonas sp. 20GA0080]|uniref:hypothetical protein n=1 Tax=Pseudomonas alliivorans TaxID=2810613 RepID=UPI001AEA25F1|nr:hypothetical protein [Pseudomonas alliivorans]MBP0948948.1 hypothetical protein [Pseudomonas alliivorans]
MQSDNYVPGFSGWKLDGTTGEFEINAANISVGSQPEQPQMITVTAGEWAAHELPKSAIEHYAFIGSEISKIPDEYRASAQIGTFDDSHEPGFVDIRTTLTYKRPETAEEAAARIKSSRSPSHSIKFDGDTLIVSCDGAPRIFRGNLEKTAEKLETPFTVQGDQVVLHKTFIDAAAFEPAWRVRTSTSADGQVIASGMGLGYACEGVNTGTPDEKSGEIAVTVEGVQYINRNLIKGEAARLVADEIIATCAAAKQ